MATFQAAARAASSFEDFCVNKPTDKLFSRREPSCLMDLVEAWLASGEGVRVCNGDYHTYTVALIGIINAWLRDPNVTRYVIEAEDPDDDQVVYRRVDSIFGEAGIRHRAFDQYWFESAAFAVMNPHLERPVYT